MRSPSRANSADRHAAAADRRGSCVFSRLRLRRLAMWKTRWGGSGNMEACATRVRIAGAQAQGCQGSAV